MTIEELERIYFAEMSSMRAAHKEEISAIRTAHSKEISDIRHDIAKLSQNLRNTEIMNRDRDQKIDRVLTLMIGDEKDEESGLLFKIKVLMDFKTQVEKTKAYITGTMGSAITIIVAIGGILAFFYKTFEFFYGLFKK